MLFEFKIPRIENFANREDSCYYMFADYLKY